MNAHGGGGGGRAPLIFKIGTKWEWIISFTPRAFDVQQTSLRYQTNMRPDWPQKRAGHFVLRTSLAPACNRIMFMIPSHSTRTYVLSGSEVTQVCSITEKNILYIYMCVHIYIYYPPACHIPGHDNIHVLFYSFFPVVSSFLEQTTYKLCIYVCVYVCVYIYIYISLLPCGYAMLCYALDVNSFISLTSFFN
jgi:hypothetical protein